MELDEAMEQGLAADPDTAQHTLAHALASANSELAGMQANLDGWAARCDELTTELADCVAVTSVAERLRIAEAFETSAAAFPEGLSVETLVFMLRLGT